MLVGAMKFGHRYKVRPWVTQLNRKLSPRIRGWRDFGEIIQSDGSPRLLVSPGVFMNFNANRRHPSDVHKFVNARVHLFDLDG